MKKYNLLKVIGITILFMFLLTLFVPTSTITYDSTYQLVAQKGSVNSVGIFGLFNNIELVGQAFISIAIFIISIGCFYAILSKLDVYNNFVKKVADKFNGKQKILSIISIIVFSLMGMFVNEPLILLVFVPFVISVMKELKIDEKAILSSTVVAILIGAMCGIYNQTLFNMLTLKINTLLLVKVILFVLSNVILILFTAPMSVSIKRVDKLEKDTKTEKKTEKKKAPSNTSVSKKNTSKKTTKGKKVTK